MSETSLAGRVALVTGGGGGIGSAISYKLASEGALVILTYSRSAARTEAVAASLPGQGHWPVQAPVDDSVALGQLAADVRARFGTLDLLVNNAGVTRPVDHADLEGLDDELIDMIFRVNWRGSFAMVRAFRDLLSAGEGGTVINISSIAGITGVGSNVAYCASKAAMDSMTRSLARALAPTIRVLSISPGFVLGEYASRMPPGLLDVQRQATPLQRLATNDDVATAVWVAATQLTFTTGTIITVDGGRPLGI